MLVIQMRPIRVHEMNDKMTNNSETAGGNGIMAGRKAGLPQPGVHTPAARDTTLGGPKLRVLTAGNAAPPRGSPPL